MYQFEITPEIREVLNEIDAAKGKIDSYKPVNESVWSAIQQKLQYEWTYDSTAIEGLSLTKGETIFFLREGLTVQGKPLKDFLDLRNHQEAVELLYETVKDERPVSGGLIKEMNVFLLRGVDYTIAIDGNGQKIKKPATPGEYKTMPNHVLQSDGTIHYYVDPVNVRSEMERLVKWINENINKEHPLVTSAVAHFNMVRIHPFDDGNGRGARLLMNLILLKKRYPPAIVRNEKRMEYIDALRNADNGDITTFVLFIGNSLKETQKLILNELGLSDRKPDKGRRQ